MISWKNQGITGLSTMTEFRDFFVIYIVPDYLSLKRSNIFVLSACTLFITFYFITPFRAYKLYTVFHQLTYCPKFFQ